MSKQAPKTQNTEFKNFQELAKNLLAVPKKEVDEKKGDYEIEKRAKKEKPAK